MKRRFLCHSFTEYDIVAMIDNNSLKIQVTHFKPVAFDIVT